MTGSQLVDDLRNRCGSSVAHDARDAGDGTRDTRPGQETLTRTWDALLQERTAYVSSSRLRALVKSLSICTMLAS